MDSFLISQDAQSAATTVAPFVPSINFSMVCPGVYRSGYPTKKNFRFLKSLKLRSICYLCPEEYGQPNQKFCEEEDIRVLRFPMDGNKEPFVDIPEDTVHRVLSAIVDARNLPLLIHCNKGKHRTGTIVGCVRKLMGWSMSSIIDEYLRFAGDKPRVGDQQYIELYRPVIFLPFVEAQYFPVAVDAETPKNFGGPRSSILPPRSACVHVDARNGITIERVAGWDINRGEFGQFKIITESPEGTENHAGWMSGLILCPVWFNPFDHVANPTSTITIVKNEADLTSTGRSTRGERVQKAAEGTGVGT